MASTSSDSQASIAQKSWVLANNIETVSVARDVDDIYRYDKKQQQDILIAKPWEKDPHFFKDIRISALALLKMVMHARSGGTLEVGRHENAIGWYHSHPGYGCWLSGIDVSTQMLNQNFQEPFVAIVIDPVRTISAGKGYKPANEEPSEYQTIPLNKIEDFGVHCKQYYSLEVSYFKSSLDRRLLDSLWNKYWVNTLSSSSLITNAEYTTGQIFDLSDKLEQSEVCLGRGTFIVAGADPHEKRTEDKLGKATKDACKTTIEVIHGLMAQMIKDRLFNSVSGRPAGPTPMIE
ncbi:JAB-MPN domain protein [Operophtera brumata]|uniref:COP9 signalosome complex subunit 5 n=1 Tax=Operophtera brumata TaxID=104452 RepID=A0A0L7KMY3_OPEBR|nr:JAB-MPN domain protein [Operophtera brumata]KOB64441.1 JAB-MPN domain protein [Operophtera brumata]